MFALTAEGGYYLLKRPGQPPAAAQTISPLNAAAKPIPGATEGAAIIRAPQLALGLPQLTSRGSPGELAAPEAPRSSDPAPDQLPKLAVGLRPIIDQVPPAVPAPTAEAPLRLAPPATVPQAKPPRKAVAHGSSPIPSPGQSSGFVKF